MSSENNIPNNPTINSESLKPFQKFCISIGAMPSSYQTAMSYQELLLWLCNYLENTVIPAIDNNAEALTELQNLFVELKNYVDNYFNNLDIQQEINNKLDEMVENGDLANLIFNYDYTTNILLFNCVNDGITDNTQNLQNAFNFCYQNNRTLYVPKGNFAFNTPISITNIPNIKMDGNLVFTGDSNEHCLILGDTEKEQNNLSLEFLLRSKEKSTTNKGLKLININNSNIKLKYINQFGTGVTLEGNTKGFCYNIIDCYNIYNNNLGLYIAPINGGWVNENLFLNGNFKYSNQLDKTNTIGIKIEGSTSYVNNNYFLKPSFEQLDIGVSLIYCSNNTFSQCRCEQVNNAVITDNLSRINIFDIGYGNIVYDLNNNTNLIKSQALNCLLNPTKIYDIIYNDKTSFSTSENNDLFMNTTDYCIMHSAGSTSNSISYNDNYLLSNNYLEQLVTKKAIGVFLDTRINKKFYARKFTKFDMPGRWFIVFYDNEKNPISSSVIGDFVETSESFNPYNDISNGYRTLADLNHDLLINVPDNAKFIFLGVTMVNTHFSIKELQIYAETNVDFKTQLSDFT